MRFGVVCHPQPKPAHAAVLNAQPKQQFKPAITNADINGLTLRHAKSQ